MDLLTVMLKNSSISLSHLAFQTSCFASKLRNSISLIDTKRRMILKKSHLSKRKPSINQLLMQVMQLIQWDIICLIMAPALTSSTSIQIRPSKQVSKTWFANSHPRSSCLTTRRDWVLIQLVPTWQLNSIWFTFRLTKSYSSILRTILIGVSCWSRQSERDTLTLPLK